MKSLVMRLASLAFLLLLASGTAAAQHLVLPRPSPNPLDLIESEDPVVAIGLESALPQGFKAALLDAIARNPALAESRAGVTEAEAGRREARAQGRPSIDLAFNSYRTLSREFDNDPVSVVERSRRNGRTDALIDLQQPLFNFGAIRERISAANARVAGAQAGVASTEDALAMRALTAWYDVFAYRTLVAIEASHVAEQRLFRDAVRDRVTEGLSAAGDIAEVDSAIAASDSRLASHRRLLAGAEARFRELLDADPPPDLAGVGDDPALFEISRDRAEQLAEETPKVRQARAEALAARREATSARADTLPSVSAGVNAGRYGVFETRRDYDVRATMSVRYRLFGVGDARADQSRARADGAAATAERIADEARRDAAIAWSDLAALTDSVAAQRRAYLASRISRDVLLERFRVARGTPDSVLQADTNYVQSAAQYLLSVIEQRVAQYALLSRTGRLVSSLSPILRPGDR